MVGCRLHQVALHWTDELSQLVTKLHNTSVHLQAKVAQSNPRNQKENGSSSRRLKGLDSFMDLLFGGNKVKTTGHRLRAPKSGGPRDSVTSYFGMRKSSMGKTPDGGLRPMINNEFVFQTGMLDQVSPAASYSGCQVLFRNFDHVCSALLVQFKANLYKGSTKGALPPSDFCKDSMPVLMMQLPVQVT